MWLALFLGSLQSVHKHSKEHTNKKFRHILTQKGYANNIKVIKHVKKASNHAREKGKQETC